MRPRGCSWSVSRCDRWRRSPRPHRDAGEAAEQRIVVPLYTLPTVSTAPRSRNGYLPDEAPTGLFIDFGLLSRTMVGHLGSEVVGDGTVPAHGPAIAPPKK